MLIGSEDFVFYDGNTGSSLDKAMEFFSHIGISQLYLLQNIGSRISVKNSLKIVRHVILNSRFDKSFLDWLFKDYIYLEHLLTVNFLFDSYELNVPKNLKGQVMRKLCESIFSKSIYQDFKNSDDKYQFLINLKSIISGYPRKLQRFILASFLLNKNLQIDLSIFGINSQVYSTYLSTILNDSDIDLSLISHELLEIIIRDYGFEGYKKIYLNSESKTRLIAFTDGKWDLLPILLWDRDINDEFIVDTLMNFEQDEDFNRNPSLLKNIEFDLVRCKRFSNVIKSVLDKISKSNDPGFYDYTFITYVKSLSLDPKSLFRFYRSLFS